MSSAVPGVKSGYAYGELRARILGGELAPGERLRLRQLADELGLSELPVREALRMLQRDGLVVIEDHRGATVAAPRAEEVVERVGIRMWLEVLAVVESTPRHDVGSLTTARTALDDLHAVVAAGDPAAVGAADRAFHEALEAPATALLRAGIREAWDRVADARHAAIAAGPGWLAAAQEAHEALLAAVTRGDAGEAGALMAQHRAATLEAWREAVAAERAG